jgi:hypothetical protein
MKKECHRYDMEAEFFLMEIESRGLPHVLYEETKQVLNEVAI